MGGKGAHLAESSRSIGSLLTHATDLHSAPQRGAFCALALLCRRVMCSDGAVRIGRVYISDIPLLVCGLALAACSATRCTAEHAVVNESHKSFI